MSKETYLELLDRALAFAEAHTDEAGRMIVDGEIDTKDSGWLVLGGVIRGLECGWNDALKHACRMWTLSSVRNDDPRSVWTTFALLYSQWLSVDYRSSFTQTEAAEIAKFIGQLDMQYLLGASRNYRVAAALIEVLRLRLGYRQTPESDPDSHIANMLEAYLGNGFFNDDDCRGSRQDRRIDAYSGEIIGLLLHYDELFAFHSKYHGRIFSVLEDFLDAAEYLIDRDGELARWGRSLRGEAEVKKIFLWECAPERKSGAPERLLKFFETYGMASNGQIFKDKGKNCGIWDEYTTHVQAQGYGIYGLAAAMHYASAAPKMAMEPVLSKRIPADRGAFLHYFEGQGLAVANSSSGRLCVIPLRNRMTKNMYFWHNRITGENDVEVDVSAKFLPLPYFGHTVPAPYSGSIVPFLPQLELANGEWLVPRNLNPDMEVEKCADELNIIQHFQFCRAAEYVSASEVTADSTLTLRAGFLRYKVNFSGAFPENSRVVCRIFAPLSGTFSGGVPQISSFAAGPSIYGAKTFGNKALWNTPISEITYETEF